MDIFETALSGVKKIQPDIFTDSRGVFQETYQFERYRKVGIDCDFVQDNFVSSERKGTIRGLHFQKPPAAQAKLISVIQGAVMDVVVDLRHGSPTFGKAEAFHLTAEEGTQIFMPVGFAHGYCTLNNNSAVLYKVSSPYAPDLEAGIIWNDPELNITWPVDVKDMIIAERDQKLPRLSELEKIFPYD